jgi:nucleotide-binding universal stress UspA family protein
MNEDSIDTAGAFRKILCYTDFSENADFAFRFALHMAMLEPQAEFHLLHVIPESDAQFWKSYIYEVENVDEKAKHDIDERIESTYRSYIPSSLTDRFHVQYKVGNEYQEILEYSQTNQIDLIVMGRQGRSGIESTLFGDVADKVGRHAGCAVMVVPLAFRRRLQERKPNDG